MAQAASTAGGPASVAEPAVNKWAVAVAVSLGALLEIIDTSIVNVALTDVQASLGATLSQVSWVVSSYGIANVIILPLAAWLGQRFGKKRYFLFSLLGFISASILCGMAQSLWMLVVARVIQGLTGGGLLAKAQAILFETFPRHEQPMAQAFFGAIVIAGPAIGPTLGGYIVTNIGWRWIFFINLPVGIVAVLAVIAALPRDRPLEQAPKPIDWGAIFLLAMGLGCLETFLEEGNAEDWFESKFITALAICSVVGLVLFVVRELKSDAPVVDLRVLRYRSLWAGSLLAVMIGMALYGALFAIPIFTQTILHFSAQQTGFLLLPSALAAAFAMPVAARITSKVDPRIVLVGGAGVLTCALVILTRLSAESGTSDLFWPLIIRSFGTVLMFLPLQLAALGPIPKSDISAATGFFALTRQLGGSVGVAALSMLLVRREAFHRAVLVENIVPSDPLTIARVDALTHGMLAKGFGLPEAHAKALALLDGGVNVQAMVLSFSDTFFCTAALVVLFLPLVFLLGKPQRGVRPAAAH